MADNNRNAAGTTGGVRYADRQRRAAEASQAVKEADAESRRVDEKTQRLRALRLAKQDAEAAALAANPPKPKAKARSRAKPAVRSIPVEDLNAEDDG